VSNFNVEPSIDISPRQVELRQLSSKQDDRINRVYRQRTLESSGSKGSESVLIQRSSNRDHEIAISPRHSVKIRIGIGQAVKIRPDASIQPSESA
jgi:hypothetical protein